MVFSAPNWRDANAYLTPDVQPDLAYWAWQFLRRNTNYQDEWSSYVASLNFMAARVPDLRPYVDAHCSAHLEATSWRAWRLCPGGRTFQLLKLSCEQIELVSFETPALPDERTFEAYASRVAGNGRRWQLRAKAAALGEKWGLEELQHPSLETLAHSNKFLSAGRHIVFMGHDTSKLDDVNYMTQQFDLRLPVDALRAQFEFLLEERARQIAAGTVVAHEGRPQRALPNYANYLRVLDALKAGANVSEMAAALLPHQDIEGAKKVIRNWTLSANKLRDSAYRTLPAFVNT